MDQVTLSGASGYLSGGSGCLSSVWVRLPVVVQSNWQTGHWSLVTGQVAFHGG